MRGSPRATVLVVEDDVDVRDVVVMTLDSAGYDVVAVADGVSAVGLVASDPPSLVLLDVMMPGISGIETLTRIRASSNVPVIMLTALGDERNKVRGLQLGADDYVVKPFSSGELLARVNALLRRSELVKPPSVIEHGRLLKVDAGRREVWLRGELIDTTAKEFDLLVFLAASPGRVYTRSELLREVWHSSAEWQQEATVTEHVRRLRMKLEADPERPVWLQTVRGVGYRFDVPDA